MKRRAHVLQQLLRGFVKRRSHEVLVDVLPLKTEHVIFVRLSQVQEQLYEEVCHHGRLGMRCLIYDAVTEERGNQLAWHDEVPFAREHGRCFIH